MSASDSPRVYIVVLDQLTDFAATFQWGDGDNRVGFVIGRDDWNGMDRPSRITLTVEPGLPR